MYPQIGIYQLAYGYIHAAAGSSISYLGCIHYGISSVAIITHRSGAVKIELNSTCSATYRARVSKSNEIEPQNIQAESLLFKSHGVRKYTVAMASVPFQLSDCTMNIGLVPSPNNWFSPHGLDSYTGSSPIQIKPAYRILLYHLEAESVAQVPNYPG